MSASAPAPKPPPDKLLLTTAEAAALLDIPEWKLKRMARDKLIGSVATGRGSKLRCGVRIPRLAVDEFLKRHSVPNA